MFTHPLTLAKKKKNAHGDPIFLRTKSCDQDASPQQTESKNAHEDRQKRANAETPPKPPPKRCRSVALQNVHINSLMLV